jgi:hypothetical protein
LAAVTVHVYVLPFVRPVTLIGGTEPLLLPPAPPLLDVHEALYDAIALPLSAPGVKATVTVPFPRVTPVMVGGSGTAAGTAGSDGSDAADGPTPLVAVTVQVYVLPLVSPLTVIADAVSLLLPGAPPSSDEHEALYDVMALPLSFGGVNETTIKWLPRAAVGWGGASGAAAGMTDADAADAGPGPIALLAVTVHV